MKTILIVGHGDVIDHSLKTYFEKAGHRCLLSGRDVDVFDSGDVERLFTKEDPEYVFLSSVRSGGIETNRCVAVAKTAERAAVATPSKGRIVTPSSVA